MSPHTLLPLGLVRSHSIAIIYYHVVLSFISVYTLVYVSHAYVICQSSLVGIFSHHSIEQTGPQRIPTFEESKFRLVGNLMTTIDPNTFADWDPNGKYEL